MLGSCKDNLHDCMDVFLAANVSVVLTISRMFNIFTELCKTYISAACKYLPSFIFQVNCKKMYGMWVPFHVFSLCFSE